MPSNSLMIRRCLPPVIGRLSHFRYDWTIKAREGTFPCTIAFRFSPPGAIDSCDPGQTTALSITYDGSDYTVCEIDLRQRVVKFFWNRADGHPYGYLASLPTRLHQRWRESFRWSCVQEHGSSASECQGNGQIRPSNAIRDAWNAGSRPYLESVLPSSSKDAYHSRQFGSHLENPGLNRPISLDVRCRLHAMTGVERWPRSGIRLNWSNM